MEMKSIKKKFFSCLTAAALALSLETGLSAVPVHAESGAIYSCTVNRSYSNPVTGEVEDSGGEASYATGQGMVEGAVYPDGMMEVTDSGNYYLTIRMSLMDYTSGHSFLVQNVGDSGWMNTGTAVTANGSDGNGTTADMCIQVPSENCVVRGSMYVDPMGRDVVFFFYPNNYSEGNSVGMTPAFVTESTAEAQANAEASAASNGTLESQEAETQTEDTAQADAAAQQEAAAQQNQQEAAVTAAPTAAPAAEPTAAVTAVPTEAPKEKTKLDGGLQAAVSPAAEEKEPSADDGELSKAQGLSLSTAEEDGAVTEEGGTLSSGKMVAAVAAAVTLSGLILMGTAALLIYYFRRNWKRWGGEDDDDDED